MPIELRETIVTPDASGDVVQLRISDAPLGDEPAPFQLTILAKLPAYQAPALTQLQRAAMKMAKDALSELIQKLVAEIQQGGHPLEPRPKSQPQVRYGNENWEGPTDN